MKTWLKITLITPSVLVEPLSDFLVGVIGSGVEVDHAETSGQQVIKVYVEKESPSAEEIQQITTRIFEYAQEMSDIFKVDAPHLDHEIIGEEDWGQTWKKRSRLPSGFWNHQKPGRKRSGFSWIRVTPTRQHFSII